VIDVHSHILWPKWLEVARAAGALPAAQHTVPGVPPARWSLESHLAAMDEHGIKASVLSWPRATDFLKGDAARSMARALNEQLAEIVSRHPRRFGALAALPLDDMDAAILEMAYALDVLGLDGVSCSTNIDGVYLGDASFDDWFAEMNRRHATLFIHPAAPKAVKEVSSGLNASILEFMFDETRMVTNLVLSGAKKRFPNIRMICTHAGGTVPFLASRVSILEPIFGAGPGRTVLNCEEVIEGLSSFYFDLTASTSAASLDAILHLVPASKLLVGYDYPMMPSTTIAPAIEQLRRYQGLQEQDLQMIFRENAIRLFPRLAH